MTNYLEIGYSKLTDQQIDVYKECIEKKSGALCLNLGAGKTLTSLVIALNLSKDKPILVVCSKTLLSSWQTEIHKFFGADFPYIIFHSCNKNIKMENYDLNLETKIILTTPEVLSKFYKLNNIQNKFVEVINEGFGDTYTLYKKPNKPFIENGSFLYTSQFGSLIVDEAQNYTNIESTRCRAIGAICAMSRWVTSGTLFDEPKVSKILGYYIMINHPKFPRSLPDTETLVKSSKFKGTKETMVIREQTNFVKPKINEFIIQNKLTEDEEKIYMSMKEILKIFNERVKKYERENNVEMARKFRSYLLAIITYLRQTLVCPLLPISNIVLDISDFQNKSDLSKCLFKEINKYDVKKYFQDENSMYSSRIENVIKTLNKHKKENIVIFTNFRTCLDVIKHFVPKNRGKVLTIESKHTIEQRGNIISDFSEGQGNVLLMTYMLGAEGLNLQMANTVLLVDSYWNDGKTKQSIGRVLRFGQKAKEVNIYYFTSNTAIEKVILERQNEKLELLEEMMEGQMKGKVSKIKTNEIIKIITCEENTKLINTIN
jgi:SNF2 family DNA or RNA helicase